MKQRSIEEYMTKTPQTIGEDIPLSKAIEAMREKKIRHLPVQKRGKVVGVLSDRDVKLALSVHPAAIELKVGDIMTEEPFAVRANHSLQDVVAQMAEKKMGCTIVLNDEERAIGVFTAVDALHLLSEWLRKNDVDKTIRMIS